MRSVKESKSPVVRFYDQIVILDGEEMSLGRAIQTLNRTGLGRACVDAWVMGALQAKALREQKTEVVS